MTARLTAVLVGLTLALLPGGAAVAQRPDPDTGSELALRLDCRAVHAERREVSVGCRWTATDHPDAAGYVVWRAGRGERAHPVWRTGDLTVTEFRDTAMRLRHTYVYLVRAVDAAGEQVEHSNRARVYTGRW